MPAVTLVIDRETGKLAGMTEKDRKGWGRFLNKVKSLADSCITFEWREPRSGPYHRRYFSMIGAAFDAQERFDDIEQFRIWLQIGAGYADFLPHPKQGVVAVPKSIGYASLEQGEFEEVANRVWAFYRSEYARQTLYPHLSNGQSWEMIETILMRFE